MERRMKDSGIKWIGEIPEEWKICKIKNIFSISSGTTPKSDVTDYWDGKNVWITPADFKTEDKIIIKGKRNISQLGLESFSLNIIPKDSIIFSKRAPIGQVVINKAELSINQGCFACMPYINVSIVFFYYLFSSYKEQFELFGSGTTFKEISASAFNNFSIQLPPLSEQQRISDFLDKKCSEIDELVSIQEQYIEELKAYKQSVITEAVTKGLNPNSEMKDSGVEWIGEIPKDWDIRKIKFIGKAENGLTYSPADVCDEKQGILVLRSSNIQNDQLDFNDNVYVNKECESLKVRKGDIIICSRNGSASLVGKNAMVTEDINATFGAFMMRFRSDYFAPYIKYLLQASISNYKTLFFTTTLNQLTIGIFNSLNVPFTSSLSDQQQISHYLDRKTSKIDSLIQIKQEKIEQLNAYKKSLIYEYVTGKKQVLN